jgi:hypothetical protein
LHNEEVRNWKSLYEMPLGYELEKDELNGAWKQ